MQNRDKKHEMICMNTYFETRRYRDASRIGAQEAQTTYISRVPQCLFPRPNWDPPPLTLGECVPPGTKWEDTLACG
jgi:hypothetical protein